jgi:hypothetical protein
MKMEKDQGTYEAFRRINVDSEVIRIINQDQLYQILFHEFFANEDGSSEVKSQINIKKYEEIKQLI